jgi:hypothetical protein
MKKHIFFFILFLCLVTSNLVQAQSSIGIKGGVNIPSVFFDDFLINSRIRSEYFISNHFGITFRHMQNNIVGIQADLLYTVKGWQEALNNEATNSVRTEITYLELPIYSHISIGKGNFKAFIDLGVYVTYALDSKKSFKNTIDIENETFTYSVEENNRGDFGLHVGAGLSYTFPFGTIQAEGNFKTAFANILKPNPVLRDQPAKSYNQVPGISVSFLYPLNKK